MSSLLQFNGRVNSHGVHLQAYQTTPSQKYMDYPVYDHSISAEPIGTRRDYYLKDSEMCGDATDVIFMPDGSVLPRLWTFARKPKGMFGCWVVFRYNGKDHVPDLSSPQGMFKLPRDARPMSITETIKTWKS